LLGKKLFKFITAIYMLKLILTGLAGLWLVFPLAQADIYFINTAKGIERLAFGSTTREILIPAERVKPQGIELDLENQKIYWTDWVAKKIQRSNLDGSLIEDLIVEGLELPEGIAVDPGGRKMYWVDSGKRSIRRANLDGSEVEDLVLYNQVNLDGISLDTDQGKMYWSEWGDGAAIGKVKRARLDGSGVQEVVAIPGALIKGIALDRQHGKVYWTDCNGSKIQRANFTGTQIEDVINFSQGSPNALAIDETNHKMYWTDQALKKLFRAEMDGSMIEEVISTDLQSPQDLTLLVCSGTGQRSIGCTPTVTATQNWPKLPLSRVYPNPMREAATIEFPEPLQGMALLLNLYNSQGQQVKTLTSRDQFFSVPGAGLPSGLYFFYISTPEGRLLSRGSITVL
jgi:low density lipoprotein receptor-related protein 5/6